MEDIRILFIGFCVYAIVYCVYAIVYCVYALKVILFHREVQLNRFKQIENNTVKLNKLYLHLVRKCGETPKENITLNEISTELRRLKRKVISCC